MKILDLINPSRTEVPYIKSAFPDGQPHIKITIPKEHVQVAAKVTNPAELMDLCMAIDALNCSSYGYSVAISYLMGGRMDRQMSPGEPVTGYMVGRMIAERIDTSCDGCVSVLDPHSYMTVKALGTDSESHKEDERTPAQIIRPNILLDLLSSREIDQTKSDGIVIIQPDRGAAERCQYAARRLGQQISYCSKVRDTETGRLSAFSYDGPLDLAGRTCAIVDDICDGGATFVGIAEQLRKHGAARVVLCVTHGIMSRGLNIAGIDAIYTTDSYRKFGAYVAGFTVGKLAPFGEIEILGNTPTLLIRDYLRRELDSLNDEAAT